MERVLSQEPRKLLFDLPDEVEGEWLARRELAQAIRSLNEGCVQAEVDAATLAKAQALVEQATALLPLGRTSVQAFAEESYHVEPARWIDRGAMSGRSNPVAPPMRVEMDGEVARCKLVLTEPYVGPPGIVHGGVVAACFDQVCGHCAVSNGFPGMTVRLEIRYAKPARLHTELEFEATVSGALGRQVTVQGSVSHDGVVVATCKAVFVILKADQRTAIFGGTPL
jgi:acyl-coenzyme A thioesterase PaaI-like protein